MLQVIKRLQWLLSSQLDASCKEIDKMSETERAEYEARNQEIAELCLTIQLANRNS
jgi:hypothetical protein